MTTLATTPTSSRRRPGPTTRIPKGAIEGKVATCMDPGLRRDDGVGEFMAETQKLIGISLEGSVG